MKMNLKKIFKRKIPEKIVRLALLILCSIFLFMMGRLWDQYSNKHSFQDLLNAASPIRPDSSQRSLSPPIVSIGISIFPPANSNQTTGTKLDITELNIVIPRSTASIVSKFCINNLFIMYDKDKSVLGFPDGTEQIKFGQTPTCYPLPESHASYTIGDHEYEEYNLDISNEGISAEVSLHGYFYYPFDGYTLNLAPRLDSFLSNNSSLEHIVLENNSILYITNSQLKEFFTPLWEIHPSRYDKRLFYFSSGSMGEDFETNNALQIRVTRPRTIQLIFILIFTTIILFIMLLVFSDNLETFVQGSIGVFFGLFGIRSVVLISDFPVITIVDLATQWTYIVFFLAIILFLIRIKFWRSPKKNSRRANQSRK